MRGLSLVAASGDHSSSRRAGLSLSQPLLLRSTGSSRAGSVVVAHGPGCSAECGIFPDQGSNPCSLHWQADSQPLCHQGSPLRNFYSKLFLFVFYGLNNLSNNSEDTNLKYINISPVFSFLSKVLFSQRSGDSGFLLIFKNKELVWITASSIWIHFSICVPCYSICLKYFNSICMLITVCRCLGFPLWLCIET